jgi:sugar/nucleoside kinase (ribokinase family)
MQGDVLVIGDLLLDIVVSPSGPIRPDGDIPAAISLLPGGQGGNLAVRLARRGRRVGLSAALGEDAHGAMLRAACAADGVELEVRPAARTGVVVILVDPDGRRSMLSNRAPTPAATDLGTATAAIVCSGYALLDPTGTELARSLGARPAGCRLVIVGCAVPSSDAARELISRINEARAELVVCNRDEALALLANDEPGLERLARVVGERLGTLAIITDPRRGSAASHAGVGPVPGALVGGPPRDPTGAGDAYAAALVDRLLDASWPPETSVLADAMRAGADLAAQVVGVIGAQARVPMEHAVDGRAGT